MEHKINPEITHFLDQYYCNPDVPESVFLQAVQEKLNQIADPDEKELFVHGIIERGRRIRDAAREYVAENEVYRLKPDDF